MARLGKLAAGVLAIILLTYVAFHGFGRGEWVANDLTRRANQALVDRGLIGALVAVETDPLTRVVHVSGDLSPDQQQQAVRIVEDVPGVAAATWGETKIPRLYLFAELLILNLIVFAIGLGLGLILFRRRV